MVIQSQGQIDPVQSDVEQAGQMLHTMEGILGRRQGAALADIRPLIARRLRITVGTLVNIAKGRRKSISHALMVAFRAELIGILQSEVIRLEHEIHRHRQIAGGHRSDALAAAEAQIVAAKHTLEAATQ
jgi:hypothetical protein